MSLTLIYVNECRNQELYDGLNGHGLNSLKLLDGNLGDARRP